MRAVSGVAKVGRGGAIAPPIASKTILAKSLNPYSSWGGGGGGYVERNPNSQYNYAVEVWKL